MSKRARPPSARAASAKIVYVKLRLYPGEDDDLIAFFEQIIPRLRAAMVKQGLRSGVSITDQTADISDEALDALESFVS